MNYEAKNAKHHRLFYCGRNTHFQEREYNDSLTGEKKIAPECDLHIARNPLDTTLFFVCQNVPVFYITARPWNIVAAYCMDREMKQASNDPFGSYMGAWLRDIEAIIEEIEQECGEEREYEIGADKR